MVFLEREIKDFNFKVAFRRWSLENNDRITGYTYDYAFELFMYDIVNPLVEKIIKDELSTNENYRFALAMNEKLERELKTSREKLSKLKKKLIKQSSKYSSVIRLARDIVDLNDY